MEDTGTTHPTFGRLPSAVPVGVLAADPLLRSGLVSALRGQPGIRLVEGELHQPGVLVAVTDDIRTLPYLVGDSARHARLVLVAEPPQPGELWAAIESGLVVLVPRKEATAERLRKAITDAHQGRGHLPPEQLGQMLQGLARLHRDVLVPHDLTPTGLSSRETTVLRLLAEGRDTAEIAAEMAYSERTVKNILHKLTTRLGLRNRTHAVSYALRHGLI
ncbi:helix-turn-helix transcriptional regulator [Amycolatopsis acidiphila]|uniref:Response regulator transcription factor n=2 Tax=Amycolatopsis acidiphila TaxID=715473 RepID=A0A558ACA6_9PSEU|nr:response regulator transcription factor [Amycolatopsis acidiphila]GHG59684.1 helix-turn-helix transcriptional regulator [Amycolatopsis acidiphila]